MTALVPLPRQPEGVPWPTSDWPRSESPVDLEPLFDRAFDGSLQRTFAVAVVQGGELIGERYGDGLDHFDRPPTPVVAETPLLSWSMAKSMLQAVIGMLVLDGKIDLDQPVADPHWSAADDPRLAITVRTALQMRDGLAFVEDYVDDQASDVIEMLFGSGAQDVAAFAADRPLAAPPGERFNYSSGTTNVLSAAVARVVGAGDVYGAFLQERLFAPLGMTTATPGFDEAGTWVASSYVHARATDYAKFGLLYLRDGVWDGTRLLPEGWADLARTPQATDPDDGDLYGSHWWVMGDVHGTFACLGYEGQSILVCPGLDLIVVRLGKTPKEHEAPLLQWRKDVIAAFA